MADDEAGIVGDHHRWRADLATADDDLHWRVWDLTTRVLVAETDGVSDRWVLAPALSRRDRRRDEVGPELYVVRWNWQDATRPPTEFKAVDAREVQNVIVDQNSGSITITYDKNVTNIDLEDHAWTFTLPETTRLWISTSADFSSDERRWATTTGSDGRVRVVGVSQRSEPADVRASWPPGCRPIRSLPRR